MNNEIGQFILKTYTDLRTSFARAKFKYSCVAFFTILRKVSNVWLYYMNFWVSRQFLDHQFLDWVRNMVRVRVRVRVRVAVQVLTVQELTVQELSCNRIFVGLCGIMAISCPPPPPSCRVRVLSSAR